MTLTSTLSPLLAAALLIATLHGAQANAAGEVNLYSARKEALIKPLLDRFSEQTGIEVNLITGKADALLQRLQSEGRNTPADLFITTDAGRLHRARAAGLTQAVTTANLNAAVPAAYREPDGHWYGLSLRVRPIFYVKDRVQASELSTYEDLADPKWRQRICIRSSGNIYNQSLVASMIAHSGEERTEAWAKGLVANLARSPKGGDRDQIKAAAAGECDLAVANTYYYGKMLGGRDQSQREAASKLAIFWPNQSGRGAHVNISGAAVTAHAHNRDNAVKLLEFLVRPESQSWYAEINYEYPVRAGVEWSDLLKQWGEFRSDNLNLSQLGVNNSSALMIMDRAGWR